jgi:hypothetical protein
MDRGTDGNLALFDALLEVLARHEDTAAVPEILQDLKSARFNYTQRDVGHLVNNLCRVLYKLIDGPLDEALKDDLRKEIRARAKAILATAAELRQLADEYEAKGGKLLSQDEILAEVAERRGGSR